jgi:hypothetical protein
MNLEFTELEEDLDKPITDYNLNPYFKKNLVKDTNLQETSKQVLKPIIKKSHPDEQENKIHRKKGISYDDILSSMNTVVIDGKLEFIRNDNEYGKNNENFISNNQEQPKKVNFNQTHNSYVRKPPIDSNMKNSYIYNKYFKDYRETNEEEHQQIPLTREQMKRKLLIDAINFHNERNRISQIKSTKLIFNSDNNIIKTRPIMNPYGINHLFKFK